jgi:hypothetical protein
MPTYLESGKRVYLQRSGTPNRNGEREMNISDIMLKLQKMKEEHGDLPVVGDYGDPEIMILEEKGEFDKCLHIG